MLLDKWACLSKLRHTGESDVQVLPQQTFATLDVDYSLFRVITAQSERKTNAPGLSLSVKAQSTYRVNDIKQNCSSLYPSWYRS